MVVGSFSEEVYLSAAYKYNSIMESLKNPIVSRLESIWGDNLLLVLQSGGSRQASPNTIHDGQYHIIVDDGNSMMEHAALMTPLIREIATEGGLPAVVASQSAFLRHLQLNQLIRYMIARDGRALWGEYALIEPYIHGLDVHQVYAQIAATMMDASAALVPQIMPDGVAEERVQQLQRLTNRLAPGADLLEAAPQVLFARLQQYLDPILRKLPLTKKWAQLGNSPTHPLLPGLQTIYTALDQTYLIFNALPGEQIIRTDWAKLADKIPGNCKGIHVTTVAQFALLLLYGPARWKPGWTLPLDPQERRYFSSSCASTSQCPLRVGPTWRMRPLSLSFARWYLMPSAVIPMRAAASALRVKVGSCRNKARIRSWVVSSFWSRTDNFSATAVVRAHGFGSETVFTASMLVCP